MKIHLASTPVDKYEIKYFSIDYDLVCEIKLIYHVNTPWKSLFPGESGGSPFTDEWQLFRDGYFEGRIEHWLGPVASGFAVDDFTTRDEANAALYSRLERRAASYEKQALNIRKQMAAAKLAAGSVA